MGASSRKDYVGNTSKGTFTISGAAVAVKADGTIICASVVANRFSDGTITCATVVENIFATGTVTCATAIVGNTVTVNGNLYTAIAGSKAGDNTKFSIDTGNNETATDLADSVDNDTRPGILGDVSASSASAVVTITSDELGVAGNAVLLVSSGATVAVSGSGTFTGGSDVNTVTVNGNLYTAVAGSKGGDNTKFSTDTSDEATGIDLADSINNDTRPGTSGDVSATESTGVVTVISDLIGVLGDVITLVSSDGTTLAVTGSGFLSGGVDADFVIVNGLRYDAIAGSKGSDDTKFSIDTDDNACALDLADSIDDDTRLGDSGDDVSATSTTDTVTVVAQNFGSGGNSIDLSSSDGTRLAVSGALLTGGIDGDSVFLNGLKYIPVAGVKNDDTEYSIDTDDTAAALDLADSIDDDVRVGDEPVTFVSTSSGAVVSITGTGTRSHAVALIGSTNVVASAAFLTLGSLASNIADEQETFKRINAMNTPYSVQATGADKDIWKQYADRIRTVDSTATFNLLTVRTRVLWGNREGYISAHVASTSLVFTWLDKTKTKINTTKTMAEVLASGSMVFLIEDY